MEPLSALFVCCVDGFGALGFGVVCFGCGVSLALYICMFLWTLMSV